MSATPRLYVAPDLAPGGKLVLDGDQAHYLTRVLRLGAGDPVRVFNGRDGEFDASIAGSTKSTATLDLAARVREQAATPDLWLLFAPIKKARTDFIVEKAVELGVARLCPVQTRFTNAERLRVDKARAHAIEAAEQCGATFVPEVAEPAPLDRLLRDWPGGARHNDISLCDIVKWLAAWHAWRHTFPPRPRASSCLVRKSRPRCTPSRSPLT